VQLIINHGVAIEALNCAPSLGEQTCADTSSVISVPAGSELTLLLYEKTIGGDGLHFGGSY
jgi:hypothetical protein